MGEPGTLERAIAQNDLGAAKFLEGSLAEAEQCYRRAASLAPRYLNPRLNLGALLMALGRHDEAEGCFREVIALNPRYAEAHNERGVCLKVLGRVTEAEQSLREAVLLRPEFPEAHSNLANTLVLAARFDEAERHYRRALDIAPQLAAAHSNLLLMLNYLPGRGPAEIFEEHLRYGSRFGEIGPPPQDDSRDAARALRVGYVSADFRQHSAAFFIEPVLECHDRRDFEVFCYSSSRNTDAVSERLMSHPSTWKNVAGIGDAELAQLIRADGIDILVDLSGHTAGNRLPAFALRPAPVQATWLGYLNTTGLDAIDWRITDGAATPAALDAFHSERLLRLPHSQWCYRAPMDAPQVTEPPAASSGRVTFGAFAAPAKVSDLAIDAWSRLLERVPGSRLKVVASSFSSVPAGYAERFTRRGIAPDRLELLSGRRFHDYLALHASIDIALDTFPYAGGTTTCHALWMGVPVVSLAGIHAASRGGASILNAVGCTDLVADSPDQYLDIARALAADPARLSALRASLRERMRASPLMDARRFTRDLENGYRSMWKAWRDRR